MGNASASNLRSTAWQCKDLWLIHKFSDMKCSGIYPVYWSPQLDLKLVYSYYTIKCVHKYRNIYILMSKYRNVFMLDQWMYTYRFDPINLSEILMSKYWNVFISFSKRCCLVLMIYSQTRCCCTEARQIYERWMEWEPDHHGWMAYIKFELRGNEVQRARDIFERYVTCIPTIKSWVRYAKSEAQIGELGLAREVYERAVQVPPILLFLPPIVSLAVYLFISG